MLDVYYDYENIPEAFFSDISRIIPRVTQTSIIPYLRKDRERAWSNSNSINIYKDTSR